MGRLSGFHYREIVKRLKSFGFAFDRQAAGSHEIWYNEVAKYLENAQVLRPGRYYGFPDHRGRGDVIRLPRRCHLRIYVDLGLPIKRHNWRRVDLRTLVLGHGLDRSEVHAKTLPKALLVLNIVSGIAMTSFGMKALIDWVVKAF